MKLSRAPVNRLITTRYTTELSQHKFFSAKRQTKGSLNEAQQGNDQRNKREASKGTRNFRGCGGLGEVAHPLYRRRWQTSQRDGWQAWRRNRPLGEEEA